MLGSFGKITEMIPTYISIFNKDYKSCMMFIISAKAQKNMAVVALAILKTSNKF